VAGGGACWRATYLWLAVNIHPTSAARNIWLYVNACLLTTIAIINYVVKFSADLFLSAWLIVLYSVHILCIFSSFNRDNLMTSGR